MTPVDATSTSVSSIPSTGAMALHIRLAFSTPSALQVLALPEFTIIACALPFWECYFVTRIGEPLTLFCV